VPIEIRRIAGRWTALGPALHFVARHEPFARFPAAALVRTLSGQIERGHCLFAVEAPNLVGFMGWAHYDAAVAERFARTGAPPPDELARGRDVLWILTAAASTPAALAALVRAVRAEHEGWRAMGIRHRPDGKRVLFDQPIRLRAEERPPAGGG
jgi:hypothetical protein